MSQTHPSPTNIELLSFIKTNYLFEKFDDSVLQNLIAEMEWVYLKEGDVLFRQGERGGGLYLVFSGKLQVAITRKDGHEVIVAEVARGKPLGEIQFLTGGSRTASVYALEKSALLKLSKTTFDHLADRKPALIQHIAEIIRHRLRRDQLLITLPSIFGPLDRAMLTYIESEAKWHSLSQGAVLFYQGASGESFFLLISGRLHVAAQDKSDNKHMLTEIRRGEIVGEMAVFLGKKRNADVYAVRYSEVVEFSKAAFERIIARYPSVTMHVMQVMLSRLQKSHSSSTSEHYTGVNIVLVATHPGVPLNEFANRLVKALSPFGNILHLNSERLDSLLEISGAAQTPEDAPNNIRLAAWLDEQENQYNVIIYETDIFASPWTKRCIQRADRILIVAQANTNPTLGEIERKWLTSVKNTTKAHQTLVLVHPNGKKLPSGTREWLTKRQVESHHHLRWDTETDFDRIARIVSGNAVGLVLGGGGARGLAHIGVIRALTEAGVPIDMIGGASIGGAISALYAMGLDDEHILRFNKTIWIESKPFNDYTLPIMSLIKGQKFEYVAKMVFGETLIEDLWVNYFCVSTNLTTTEVVTHREGLLAKALRATASLPGIAVPLVSERNLLVDGGVLNNLPIDIMRELCSGTVIAVNVSQEKDLKLAYERFPSPWKVLWNRLIPFKKPISVPNIFDLLMRTTMVGSIYKTHAVKVHADLYLEPPLNQFKLLDFKSFDQIVEVGYEYTKEKLKDCRLSIVDC